MAIKTKIQLKQQNDAQITTNTNREITGAIMHNHLNDFIDSLLSISEYDSADSKYTIHFPTIALPIAIANDKAITLTSNELYNINSILISINGGTYHTPSYPIVLLSNDIFRIQVESFINPATDGVLIIKYTK